MIGSERPALACRSLVVSAHGKGQLETPFLRGADLTVRPGDVILIEGLSSCEQRALAQVLYGSTPPVYGSVHIRHELGRVLVLTDLSELTTGVVPGDTVVILTQECTERWRTTGRLRAYGGLLLEVTCERR